MTNPARQLLVPINVAAFVADMPLINDTTSAWSPQGSDYAATVAHLDPMGPRPFFLQPARPTPSDFGVHLHWTVPDGLRHAQQTQAGKLDFPPLPDRWLVVRFARYFGEPPDQQAQAAAWLIDSSVAPDPPDPRASMLILPDDQQPGHVARRMGQVIALKDDPTNPTVSGTRTTLTAVGNSYTGSPHFTAFVADNRNMLSWHDDLADLRTSQDPPAVDTNLVLTYLVVGWYDRPEGEPLTWLQQRLKSTHIKSAVLDALGWQIGPAPASEAADATPKTAAQKIAEQAARENSLPADLLDPLAWRCLFHGMVAHTNFWSRAAQKDGQPHRYQGPALGAPDPVGTRVGVGNNAADALIALLAHVSDEAPDAPAAWKALEAVIYRQVGSLLSGWQETPREFPVHQSWFRSLHGGTRWIIKARERDDHTLGVATTPGAKHDYAPQPTEDQLDALRQLNLTQAQADEAARALAATQQEYYARWWLMTWSQLNRQRNSFETANAACTTLAATVGGLQKALEGLTTQITDAHNSLKSALDQQGLVLSSEAAGRFWLPSDPVIVVSHIGRQDKHAYPNPLVCRSSELVCPPDPSSRELSAEVNWQGAITRLNPPTALTYPLKALTAKKLPDLAMPLAALLDEAGLVEAAVNAFATTSAPEGFVTRADWNDWRQGLVEAMAWGGDSSSKNCIKVETRPDDGTLLSRLASLWGQQPWSPLFLDWQVKYHPSQELGKDFSPTWRREPYDFEPADSSSAPDDSSPAPELWGRSSLSPMLGRFFTDPIADLAQLLTSNQMASGVVGQYLSALPSQLDDLASSGLLGQTLSGFHQAFLRRNPRLPRVTPDPAHPWVKLDPSAAQPVPDLDQPASLPDARMPVLPNLPPPEPSSDGLPFGLLRAGSCTIEALWIVDDFGQFVDLLGQDKANLVLSPHSLWPGSEPNRMALPPRFVQPARLDFSFLAAGNPGQVSQQAPDTSPICGWVFHNYLDQALTLCDRAGAVLGELILLEEARNGFSVLWTPLTDPSRGLPPVSAIEDPTLRGFVQGLLGSADGSSLKDLLVLIDGALAQIRPAGRNAQRFPGGRLLALANARLGLELYGQAWSDPQEPLTPAPTGATGDPLLDSMSLPLQLGCAPLTQDGLIGYYRRDADGAGMNRITPVNRPAELAGSLYVVDPDKEENQAHAGFGNPEQVTLLLDPHGVVHASAGILPAKSIRLPAAYLKSARAQMELSFRVAPVLLHKLPAAASTTQPSKPPTVALPTPAGGTGQWRFRGPAAENSDVAVTPPAHIPNYDAPRLVATEGRLVMRTDRQQPAVVPPDSSQSQASDHTEQESGR